MKKLIFSILFIIPSICAAEFNRTTGVIDIPTAYVIPKGVIKVAMTGSFTNLGALNPGDADFTISYGLFDRAELALTSYTFSDYSLNAIFQILKDEGRPPGVAFGIDDLTYRRHISSLGGEDDEWEDDALYPLRCSEQFSVFLIMSKNFGKWGTYHLGFGRGRFIGYGPRSSLFNSDIFSDVEHNDAVGTFWGGEIEFMPGLWSMFDFDGRDFNIGMKFKHPYFDIGLSAVKIEHRLPNTQKLFTRVAFGISVNSTWMMPREPVLATIRGVIKDRVTKEPIDAIISFPATDIPSVKTTDGEYTVTLPPGKYTIRISKKDYIGKGEMIDIKEVEEYVYNFSLKKSRAAIEREELEKKRIVEIEQHMDKGVFYFISNKLKEATSEFQTILVLDPTNQKALNYLGLLREKRESAISLHKEKAYDYEAEGKYSKAMSEWEAVLEYDSSDMESLKAISNLKAKLAAARKPKPPPRPTRPTPKKPTLSKAEIDKLVKEGIGAYMSENYKEAISIFKKVLAVDPGNAKAKKYLGKTQKRLEG